MTREQLNPAPSLDCDSAVSASVSPIVLRQSHLLRCALPFPGYHRPRHPQHQQRPESPQLLRMQLSRLLGSALMPAVVDTPSALVNGGKRRALGRRTPAGHRGHVVTDPAAGSWDGQQQPAVEPGTDRDADLISISAPSLPPVDEVHTFPGICDDHPLDDLSSIAIAPLTYDGMLHSCSEQMQSDDILPPPEVGSLPHHITAEHQSAEVFPAESFPAATALLEQQETKLLLQKVGIFQPDVSSHMHSVSATEDGQQMLLKQEALCPTDLVTPGTSGCGEGAYASCSAAQAGSPSSPVIPLTALELISQDSDSSGSDTAQASSSGGRPAGRSSTSGGTLDRRKVSDDADSSDDTLDEDMSVDDQERLDRRRLSNRVAAQKCRTRQRQHYRGLMKEIQDWECKNTGLNYEVRQLQKTLKTMLQKVAEHEAHCTTGKSALTPAEKEAYQKLIDDVTASLANPKDSGKPSK